MMQNNILFELFPLGIFFLVYFLTKDIFLASGFCIGASWIQLLSYKLFYRKISKNTWISVLLITLFGGLSIILHNKTFVMIKPTALYWLVAISLFISDYCNKNGIKILLASQYTLSDKFWRKINFLWVFFFLALGVLNLLIAFYCSEYFWVKFKVFGGLILMIIWTIITGLLIHNKART